MEYSGRSWYTFVPSLDLEWQVEQAKTTCTFLVPHPQGIERRDLIAKNVPIMAEHGRALAKCASEGVRVLVVANPACTNCLIVSQENAAACPTISATSWLL